jgi:hypothetical protein
VKPCGTHDCWYKLDLLGEVKLMGSYLSHTDPTPYVAVVTMLMFVLGLTLLASVVRELRARHVKRLSDWPKNSRGFRRDA